MTAMPAPAPAAPVSIDAADLPFSAAAERNAAPILVRLLDWLPSHARVLEIASGTGQHARHFAAAQPSWDWQPTETQAQALPAIAARCTGLPNVRAPRLLDVLATGGRLQAAAIDAASDSARTGALTGTFNGAFDAAFEAAFDAVYAANLLHIAPWAVTPAFLHGAARCLAPGGQVLVYGPFVVDGEPLAPSNAAFDADLRARDPRWGLRPLHAVQAAAQAAGLVLAERCAMPANNLLLRFTAAARTSESP